VFVSLSRAKVSIELLGRQLKDLPKLFHNCQLPETKEVTSQKKICLTSNSQVTNRAKNAIFQTALQRLYKGLKWVFCESCLLLK
jgi:hypothetical protein